MPRVKGGTITRKKHKKLRKLAKGYYGARHRLHKKIQEAVLHSGEYAFAGRRQRRRDLRGLWIARINAALKPYDLKYSLFVNMLKTSKIALDRKTLSEIAITDTKAFEKIVSEVKS